MCPCFAEEAVADVRRAAVTEVQRAVSAADTRAQELVAAERVRFEALLRELGRREPPPDHHRHDPHQVQTPDCRVRAQG